MQAISIRCPECGAKLRVPAACRETDCEYCGTKSQIRYRTGFFERVETGGASPSKLPVATQRHSTSWHLGLSAIPVVLIGISVPLIASERSEQSRRLAESAAATAAAATSASSASIPTEAPPPPKPTWKSMAVALVDANGDGALDVVGRTHLRARAEDHLVAFDGTNGEPLWSTELSLTSDSSPRITVAEDTVILAQTKTRLRGFALRDGSERWTRTLPETLSMRCQGIEPSTIVIQTADKQWHTLQLKDGSVAPLSWLGPCRSLSGDSGYLSRFGQIQIEESFDRTAIALESPDMDAKAAIYDIDTKVAIALAAKKPGTAVPMLARYEVDSIDARITEGDLRALRLEVPEERRKDIDKGMAAARRKISRSKAKVLWTTTVPSSDPLEAATGPLSHQSVTLYGDTVVAAWVGKGGKLTLSAFNIADGARRWDVPLFGSARLSQIVASLTHVYIVRGTELKVLRLEDGSEAFSIP